MLRKLFNKKSAGVPAQTASEQLTVDEIRADEKADLSLIADEFKHGFDFIKKKRAGNGKSVTFFGSARFHQDNEYCQKARLLASRVVKDLNYDIVDGGGGGIMEAVSHGAHDAGGSPIGITVKLKHPQKLNRYIGDSISLTYFFVRKTMLTFAAEAFVFFPGGFGTLDEFFDILTLVQTEKIPRVPLILVGGDYWRPLDAFIKEQLVKNYKTVSANEAELYQIMDDPDHIIEAIRKSPPRNWWKDFEIVKKKDAR